MLSPYRMYGVTSKFFDNVTKFWKMVAIEKSVKFWVTSYHPVYKIETYLVRLFLCSFILSPLQYF